MTTSELIARLERKLAVARRVPTHRREAECADVIEDTCRAMLDDLYSGRDRERPWPRGAAPGKGRGGATVVLRIQRDRDRPAWGRRGAHLPAPAERQPIAVL